MDNETDSQLRGIKFSIIETCDSDFLNVNRNKRDIKIENVRRYVSSFCFIIICYLFFFYIDYVNIYMYVYL